MSIKQVFKSIYLNPGNKNKKIIKTFNALNWQLRKRILKSRKIIKLPNGVLFNAYHDCVISSALIYSEWPEYNELMFLRSNLNYGDIIIDVGANVGHVSLLLADIVGINNIIAFEPTPVSFKRLVENWNLNSFPTDGLYQNAVGDRRKTVFIKNSYSPFTTNKISNMKNYNDIEVDQVNLDGYCSHFKTKEIGLLKIDVEGYELNVFKGAREFLTYCHPKIIMFESLEGSIDKEIEQILNESGYLIFQLDGNGLKDFSRLTAQNIFAVYNK